MNFLAGRQINLHIPIQKMSSLSSKVVWSWSSTAILMVFFSLSSNQYCEGKRMCYICNTTTVGDDGPNKSCLDAPENITSLENPSVCRHFCTITRKEFLSIPGDLIVVSLERNCEERPVILDGVGAENNYKTYYRSCRANLCNGGDGVTSLKDILDEPDEPEDEELTSSSSSYFYPHICNPHNYTSTSIRIFKIYFFVFVAYIFSIT